MRRRKTAIFFLVLGISLSALAIALNVGWIILNLREAALLIFGVIFFALIITGLILNTIFLIREIRRNEQHDAFLNAVTHELKTPLASIRLYLDTLRTREPDAAKRREFYDIMKEDSERLLGTVEQVLLASRTREKGRLIDREILSLSELIEESIAFIRGRRGLSEEAMRFVPPPVEIEVLGDREELRSALGNILDNAVKYSGDEPRVTVTLTARERGLAEISVADNGVGIPPADLKRVFKRFYRVPGRAGVKGTGLGLAIVQAIVEKHGGRVTAESRGTGKGSTFTITLPRA
ncbi:MAG: HAMP domain-containing histidine kinase [Acidobacteriota bacterium]|nr:MAG: HAMP domain-containing histidine kinase [Acidobacteriota bacterium]